MANLYIIKGRFQPFHVGHMEYIVNTVNEAAIDGDKVLILIGSAFESRSPKNPFTYQERHDLIRELFPDRDVYIQPLVDYRYDNEKWLNQVNEVTFTFCKKHGLKDRILSVVGKDETTVKYQEDVARELACDIFTAVEADVAITHASDIRAEYFAGTTIDNDYFPVPTNVREFLKDFRYNDDYRKLVNEVNATRDYKKSWEHSPFPPVFVAVDVVPVVKDAWGKPHVALITRKSDFGHGKFALAGGFLDVDEEVFTSAMRETREEMGNVIAVLLEEKKTFKLRQVKVFDEPNRSARGRMITFVHHYEGVALNFPKLVAGDDAATADWYGIDWIANNRHRFFADHWHILDKLLNLSQYENIENYL